MVDKVSIVIPIYDEEGSIPELYASVKKVMESTSYPWELVFIDDGSRDGSLRLLEEIQKGDARVIVVAFRRNFGQTAALAAGFDYSTGDVVVTMDGDLQNDPADIPMMLGIIKDCDVVSGWRKKRKDPFLTRRLPSRLANGLISFVTGVRLHDYGCTLKAYRREVIKDIRLYGDMHRFIPAIASWVGADIREVETTHHPRRYGTSKYGLGRTVRVVLDLMTVKFLQSFATRPIQAFGPAGLALGGVGFFVCLYLTYEKFALGMSIGGRPLLLLGVLLIILGLQCIIMGLLGEMLTRVYHESQSKPVYTVRKVVGEKGGGE